MLVPGKHKYYHKTLSEKCRVFWKKGMSNKDVAAKYCVPRNTLSTWVKCKEELSDLLEKGSNITTQKLRTNYFEMVDKAQLVPKYVKSKCFIYYQPS